MSDERASYWFDASPLLTGGAFGRLRPRGRESRSLVEFVSANGLVHSPTRDPQERDFSSLIVSDACKDVVTTADGAPRIEFGNHGLRYWVGDDHRPSRRGYIAINHGLAAPHLFFKSGEFGALTTLNVASATVTFLSVFDNAEGGSFETPLSAFGERSERLEMPKRIGFAALAEKERLDDARALLTPAVLPLLTELAASFDVEVHDGWIFAYSLYGDVVTDDPAVWAWVFGVASRMLDVVELWDGPPAAAAFPLYTANRIERPAKLDGSLSRLKRSKK